VAVNCLDHLNDLKNGSKSTQNLGESIENYKIQLGKYHKILLLELKNDQQSKASHLLVSEKVLKDHKNKLLQCKDEEANPEEGLTEILLSLRVNALQIPPDQRRNLVSKLIKVDILHITAAQNYDFVLSMLKMNNHGLKHSLLALLSVLASIPQGVHYLTHSNPNKMDLSILDRTIDILKEQENGSVTQRFNIAFLQKVSA
jgi:hypothetical protein